MTASENQTLYSDDQPLPGNTADDYHRRPYAEAIAREVVTVPASHGFVIGIIGAWGSGKTTVLNQIETSLANDANTVVLRFNPWLFSGTHQLVSTLLLDLSREIGRRPGLGDRAKAAAKAIGAYGKLLGAAGSVPGVGTLIMTAGAIAQGAAAVSEASAEPSLQQQRDAVRGALIALNKRLVIVLDDIDRLADQEIRDVMRLVRLVADFPNTVYLLAFDRTRVERVLGNSDGEGRQYLEKIVQITHDIPALAQVDLAQSLRVGAAKLQDTYPDPVDELDLLNIVHMVVAPLLTTPRDVHRVLNAVPSVVATLGAEVAFPDILAVESFRVLRPDIYKALLECRSALTNCGSDEHSRAAFKTQLDQLVTVAGADGGALVELLGRVFPASGNSWGNKGGYGEEWKAIWRRKRRVAELSVFTILAERALREGQVPTSVVRGVISSLAEPEQLTAKLATLSDAEFEDLLDRVTDYESQFPLNAIESAIEAFSNQWDRLRIGRLNSSDYGADMAMGRLTLRLLRRIQEEHERSGLVRRVIPRIASLSARLDLIDMAGHRKGAGQGLIDRATEDELLGELWDQTLDRPSAQLAHERDVGKLLWRCLEAGSEDADRVRDRLRDNDVFLAFIRSLLAEAFSRPLADLAESIERSLPFESIFSLIDEALFDDAVVRLEQAVRDHAVDTALLDDRGVQALDLATKHRLEVAGS